MEEFIKTFQDFMVLIRCFTYNHAAYITDTLNGFTMQQTTFPFVIVVVDDASNDGEQKVIQDYVKSYFEKPEYETESDNAHITFAHHSTNKNCYIAVYNLKENHYSQKRTKTPYTQPWRDKCKYEAICEGDDYWIDPLKLQKQVDFLDANPEYSMCFHNAVERVADKLSTKTFSGIKDKEYTGVMLFKKWLVPTASVMLRVNVLESDIYSKVLKSNNFIYGDTPMFCACAEVGKVRGFSDTMSVYRRHCGGMTANKFNLMDFRFYKHQEEFYHIFGIKYKCSFYISNYYSYVIIKLILKRQFSKIITVIKENPYPEYLPINLLVFPFTYLISKVKEIFN